MRSTFLLIVLLPALLLLAAPAVAEVKLAPVFGDSMVLQRGILVPVWGTALPGEKIIVAMEGSQVETTATKDGRWMARIGPFKAGGPFTLRVSCDKVIELEDVLVGEVWLCSGQSNMEWQVRWSGNAKVEIAAADHPQIRLLHIKRNQAQKPLTTITGKWAPCTPKTIPGFSATAYYFGRFLHQKLKVPIGLIESCWGGTVAEAWMPMATLKGNPDFRPIVDRWENALKVFPRNMEKHKVRLKEWEKKVALAKAAKKSAPNPEAAKKIRIPRRPGQPFGPGSRNAPSALYNAMINPLLPFGIKGVIWYQGEANASRAHQYQTLFPAMINDWRRAWGQGNLPFLFVQLAAFGKGRNCWAELREAQTMALKLRGTGMAVAIDIGEKNNIHPKNKQDVGRRLGLAALGKAYRREIVFSGPIYKSMKIRDKAVVLRFRHAANGLLAKGKELTGFLIAGKDKKFYPAKAEIRKRRIAVHSPQVPQPVAVRYGWADFPICNLYNKDGLPASPFRTDDWPGLTVGKK